MKSFTKIIGPAITVLGVGFLVYQGLIVKSISTQQMIMGIGLVAVLALSMYNASLAKARGGNKVGYREGYAEFIGDAFADDKKLEQKLFVALENLGRKKNTSAIKRLDELLPLCRNDDERFTVHVFKGMAYSRDNEAAKAAESYKSALSFKESTTAYSNLGMCLSKTTDLLGAEKMYLKAIELDENNAYAHNNLAQLYIQFRDFPAALEQAMAAYQINDRLLQAVNAITICHGVMGNEDKFGLFYKLSTTMGANGKALNEYIEELKKEEVTRNS